VRQTEVLGLGCDVTFGVGCCVCWYREFIFAVDSSYCNKPITKWRARLAIRQHTRCLPPTLRRSADLSLIAHVLIKTSLHESRTKAGLLAPRYFWQWVITHCSDSTAHVTHSGQYTYSATGFNVTTFCIFPTERVYKDWRKCGICKVKVTL